MRIYSSGRGINSRRGRWWWPSFKFFKIISLFLFLISLLDFLFRNDKSRRIGVGLRYSCNGRRNRNVSPMSNRGRTGRPGTKLGREPRGNRDVNWAVRNSPAELVLGMMELSQLAELLHTAGSCSISGKLVPVENGSLDPITVVNSNQVKSQIKSLPVLRCAFQNGQNKPQKPQGAPSKGALSQSTFYVVWPWFWFSAPPQGGGLFKGVLSCLVYLPYTLR